MTLAAIVRAHLAADPAMRADRLVALLRPDRVVTVEYARTLLTRHRARGAKVRPGPMPDGVARTRVVLTGSGDAVEAALVSLRALALPGETDADAMARVVAERLPRW